MATTCALRTVRKAAGLTQAALALHLGYSWWTIVGWETGRRRMSQSQWEAALALCQAEMERQAAREAAAQALVSCLLSRFHHE